jgi:endonuclease/exonuclease/phosphatase (EEP) superfamily protein YafD
VLQAVVGIGGCDLLVLPAHIDDRPDDAERLANVEQLREVLVEYGNMPTLLGGDFNDTPASRTCAAMAAAFDGV